jgi:signal transduction histidine kinase/DNA-binding response OmpR family regulator/HPt (histidine-containing phosphotransfer) domain-containing protein
MALTKIRLLPRSLITGVIILYWAIMLVLVSAGMWLFISFQYQREIETAQDSATMMVEVTAQTITDSAIIGDYDTIKSILGRYVLNPQFSSAAFIDLRGGVLRVQGPRQSPGYIPDWLRNMVAERLYDANHTISAGGTDYGVLRLEFSVDAVAHNFWMLLLSAVSLNAAGLILGSLLIGLAMRRWLASFQRLDPKLSHADAHEEMVSRELLEIVPVEFRPTFDVLQSVSLNLRQELRQREQALTALRRALTNLMPDTQTAPTAHNLDIAALSRVVLQVVEERESSHRALEAAVEAAQAANRAKSEFLAMMSHEIRTPMNGVIGMTALTLETELTPKQREYLSMVQKSADALLVIINDILDFSKIEAGQLQLDLRPFRIHSLVRSTLSSLDSQAQLKGLKLVYEPDAKVPLHLIGDSGRLRQILTNLVGNAIKFSAQGQIEVRVKREADQEGQVVLRIEVQDQGIGIDPEKQKTIFDPFTQADSSITRRFGGTGLGLAICAKLVHAMGGKIFLRSAPGQGSNFHFTSRFDIDHSGSTSDIFADPRGGSPGEDANTLRVLLVEDNEVNQLLAQSLLRQEGHEVEIAGDGAQALQKVTYAEDPYDLILMDMQMPVMDGLEATRRIRAHERQTHQHVRIIAMTANALPEDRKRCLAAGMDDYLSKPISIEKLRTLLRLYERGASASPPTYTEPMPLLTRSAEAMPSYESHQSTQTDAYDYGLALAQADNMVVHIIGEAFRSSWGQQMQEMQQALAQNDADLLRRVSHSLRGVVGNFEATPAVQLCREIEHLATRGETPGTAALIERLELELSDLDLALQHYLREHPPG